MGLIYCYTNKLNGKNYVGLTQQSLDERERKHLSQLNDNSYFHRAIKKYGLGGFIRSILEDDIENLEVLKQREIYWIKEKHAYIDDGGYNLTKGGDSVPKLVRKLSDEQVNQIQNLILTSNYSLTDISNNYNVSIYAISDINRGKSWWNPKLQYPLRVNTITEMDYIGFIQVLTLLQTGLFSCTQISERFNISESVISKINTGKYTKFEYPEYVTFPILQCKIVNNGKISVQNTLLLVKDFLSSNITRKDLAIKYNISDAYVKQIVGSNNKKPYLQKLKIPLRDFKQYNLDIINSHLSILNEYS